MSTLCAICYETFEPSDDVRLAPCGHIFHHMCLMQWLERCQTCPQCRTSCPRDGLARIYISFTDDVHNSTANREGNVTKRGKVAPKCLEVNVREQEKAILELTLENAELKGVLVERWQQLESKDFEILELKNENAVLTGDRIIKQKLEEELAALKLKLEEAVAMRWLMTASAKRYKCTYIDLQNENKELSESLHRLENELSEEWYKRKALEATPSTSNIYGLEQLSKQGDGKIPNASAESENSSPSAECVSNPRIRRKRLLDDQNVSTPMSKKMW